MSQKLLSTTLIALTTFGTTLFPAVSQAQNANTFSDVSSLFGVSLTSLAGSHNLVSVDAGAYYILNGSRHDIKGVVGVYELFDHTTNSPLPASNPFPLIYGDVNSTTGSLTRFGSSFNFSPGSGMEEHPWSGNGLSNNGQHLWNLKNVQDARVFGYEAYNDSAAVLSSHSLSPFIFNSVSSRLGFRILDMEGNSSYISNRPDPIPEGSGLVGFSCLTVLGSFSMIRQRARQVRT